MSSKFNVYVFRTYIIKLYNLLFVLKQISAIIEFIYAHTHIYVNKCYTRTYVYNTHLSVYVMRTIYLFILESMKNKEHDLGRFPDNKNKYL